LLQRPGAIVAGKYRIEKPLAKGGIGTVWIARHVQLKHEVAVKFLDPRVASSPQVRARFEREARASAQLRTPHIVQVFDYGIEQDTPYLVMELLRGETLHQRLRREKRLGVLESYAILVQIGKGLRRAHEVGFVHRDMKPANLFLAQNDDEETVVKILDFGIAKETGGELAGESTRTGELVGSPHYMSPEQIRGEREVDTRSDLWALGVILYKMITGYLPFPGEVLTAVITKIVVDPIPPARQYLPEAPVALDAFFDTALQRDKNKRFQSVADLVRAFGEVAAEIAGVSVQSLGPASLASRASLGSFPDIGTPSGLPSSIPGLTGSGNFRAPPLPSVSHLGALTSGSYPGGSFPGASVPGSLPPPTPPPRASQPSSSAAPSGPQARPPRPPPPRRTPAPSVAQTIPSGPPQTPQGAVSQVPQSAPPQTLPSPHVAPPGRPSSPHAVGAPPQAAEPQPSALQPRPPQPSVPEWLGSIPGGDASLPGAAASSPAISQVPAPAPISASAPGSAPISAPSPGSVSSPGAVSSMGTLASPEVAVPAPRPRKTPWIAIALGLVAAVALAAFGALRLRSAPATEGSSPPLGAGAMSSAPMTSAPAPPPATEPTNTAAEPTTEPTATAAPSATESATSTADPASSGKPRAGTGTRPRLPGGKKPVDTID